MEDITSLQQLITENNPSAALSNQIRQLLLWLIVPSVITMFILIIILVGNTIRRYRVEHAIFEIRDMLRAMQQSQQQPDMSQPELPMSAPARSSAPETRDS